MTSLSFTAQPRSTFFPAILLGALLLPGSAPGAPQRIPLEPTVQAATLYRPGPITGIGDRFYFRAFDPLYGDELWVSDGSAPGTYRLSDICPGTCSAYPSNFQAMGGRIFFTASAEGVAGLYALDGDEVSLIGRFSGYAERMVASGDAIYLRVLGDHRLTLFRSRGEPGDLEVFDQLCENFSDCDYNSIDEVDGNLFFVKNGSFQRVQPDGTISRLAAVEFGHPIGKIGGRFLFWGCDAARRCSTYSSDGTPEGTARLLAAESLGVGNLYFYWKGAFYWAGAGARLARTDGTEAGTTVVPGVVAESLIGATPGHLFFIRSGTESRDRRLHSLSTGGVDTDLLAFDYFDPELLGILGESIFVTGNGGTLHVSDGTPAGTRLLEDLTTSLVNRSSAVIGGLFYAPVHDRSATTPFSELRRFDAAGNSQEAFPPRFLPAGDGAKVLANSSLIAFAEGTAPTGYWQIDPQSLAASPWDAPGLEPVVAAGDRAVVQTHAYPHHYFGLSPAGVASLPAESPAEFAAGSDGKLFWGQTGPGQTLWETDGTLEGTRQLHDFWPGYFLPPCNHHCNIPRPSDLKVAGDKIFLVAAAAPDSNQTAVWAYDRRTAEATRLNTFHASEGSSPVSFLEVGAGKVVYNIEDGFDDGHAIWASDGTVAGTYLIRPGQRGQSPPEWLGAVGQRFFFAERGELWISELTPGHLDRLLSPAEAAIQSGSATAAGDRLFFAADSFEHGVELWTSDGTRSGTRELDLRPGPLGSWPTSLLAVGQRLIFAVDDGTHGKELYQSDGTREGTTLLADVAPGPAPSTPESLVAVGERVLFTADDGVNGRGLWSFDLPAPRPACPAGRLCLRDGRFEVSVTALGQQPVAGSRVLASDESGVFSFFAPNNWELLVKVLDGCRLNQRFWVYSAAATDVPFVLTVLDRASGQQRTYSHAGGTAAAPDLDGEAFATCGAAPLPAAYSAILPAPTAAPRCADDFEAFCFGPGGRFRAKAEWYLSPLGGIAHPEPYGSADSGLFSFFNAANWELMVKVLDGCAINGRHWVYVAATTDVGWKLLIEDRLTGQVRVYEGQVGLPAPAVTDGLAFGGCN